MPEFRQNKPCAGQLGGEAQGERCIVPLGHAITLSAFGGGVGAKTGMYLVGNRVRRLHPRVQKNAGFPEVLFYTL